VKKTRGKKEREELELVSSFNSRAALGEGEKKKKKKEKRGGREKREVFVPALLSFTYSPVPGFEGVGGETGEGKRKEKEEEKRPPCPRGLLGQHRRLRDRGGKN